LGFPGKILVLCGDMPLIKIETVRKLLGYHDEKKSSATVLTGIVENPGAYGRIARDADGELDSIVEFADADEKIRGIKEVNSGCYVFESEALWSSLSEIGSENAQGEYYLPDIIKLLKNKGATVAAFPADEPDELMGVNTPEELAQAEKIISSRRKG
jgi:bifunctional UDP-N-acetylglucosamine pyrophosphorylase/glucosamine-1-phosphate N-acetyltransferase